MSNFGPPCPPCKHPEPSCVCDEYARLADELAFPIWDVECSDSDCALRDGHTVPHMSDLALAWYDGAGRVVQKILPL